MTKISSKAQEIDKAVANAKRAVDREMPFSPSWDAAMAVLEDAERERWELDGRVSSGIVGLAHAGKRGEDVTA
jgi:hypothetical protein